MCWEGKDPPSERSDCAKSQRGIKTMSLLIGAIDETNLSNPHVFITDYIYAMPQCLEASKMYPLQCPGEVHLNPFGNPANEKSKGSGG